MATYELERIKLVYNKRLFIFWFTTTVAIITVIISLFLPLWYESSAMIKSSGSQKTNFMSMMTGIPLGDLGFGSMDAEMNEYITLLESRTIKEMMVKKFDLIERYESRDIEFAMNSFSDKRKFEVTEFGALKISIVDKDPNFAKAMMDSLLLFLDKEYKLISQKKNGYNRQFLEKRLNQNIEDLTVAEIKLKEFMQANNVLDIPTQTSAAMENYSYLYSEKIKIEIEHFMLMQSLKSDNIQIKQLEKLIEKYDGMLSEFTSSTTNTSPFIAFDDIPEVGMQYSDLLREVEIQSKIMELLLPQFEQAKMEEGRDVPSIIVIDNPKVALNKAKPKRSIIVIGSTFSAFVLSILYIVFMSFFREFYKELTNE